MVAILSLVIRHDALANWGETIYGLTSISRANCLSEASFRPADVHLFACGDPATQGKASGALCLLTLFGHANKVRRLAGRNPPILNLIL